MTEQRYVWFLLGLKAEDNSLRVFAMGRSVHNPELKTEHEPRALAVLKKGLPKSENTEGFTLHASRISLGGTDPNHVRKERKRWRDEFQQFLAKGGLTLVEQLDMIEAFAEETLNFMRGALDTKADMPPVSESLWGKKTN